MASNIEPERETQGLIYLKHPVEADTILYKKLQEQILDFRRHALKKTGMADLTGLPIKNRVSYILIILTLIWVHIQLPCVLLIFPIKNRCDEDI